MAESTRPPGDGSEKFFVMPQDEHEVQPPNPEAAIDYDNLLENVLTVCRQLPYVKRNTETGRYQIFTTDPLEFGIRKVMRYGKLTPGMPENEYVAAQNLLTEMTLFADFDETDDYEDLDAESDIGKFIKLSDDLYDKYARSGIAQLTELSIKNTIGTEEAAFAVFNLGLHVLLQRPAGFSRPPIAERKGMYCVGRVNDHAIDRDFRATHNTLARVSEIDFTQQELRLLAGSFWIEGGNFSVNLQPLYKKFAALAKVSYPNARKEEDALASGLNKLNAVAVAHLISNLTGYAEMEPAEFARSYAKQLLAQLVELESSRAEPYTLSDKAKNHILHGDKNGGGHVLETINASHLEVLSSPESIAASRNPRNNVTYGIVRNKRNGTVGVKTFFPGHWSPSQVIETVEQPVQLVFQRDVGRNIQECVKTGNFVLIRIITKRTGECITGHPAFNEMPNARLRDMNAEVKARHGVSLERLAVSPD